MSSTYPNAGSPLTKRITTGRLYCTLAGGTGQIDFGNIVKFQRQDKRDAIEHYASVGGVRVIDAEIVHTLKYAYRFTLDEYTDRLASLLQNAVPVGVAGVIPMSAPGSPVTIPSVRQGCTYDLGGPGLTSAVLTDTTPHTPLTLAPGIDYVIDLMAGKFTVLAGGQVTDGDTISATLSFGAGASYRTYVSATQPTTNAAFEFYEADQLNPGYPRAIHTFQGSAVIQSESEEQTTGFRTAELLVTCTSAPIVKERS